MTEKEYYSKIKMKRRSPRTWRTEDLPQVNKYVGESARSLGERTYKHWKDSKSTEIESHIRTHWESEQRRVEGSLQIKIDTGRIARLEGRLTQTTIKSFLINRMNLTFFYQNWLVSDYFKVRQTSTNIYYFSFIRIDWCLTRLKSSDVFFVRTDWYLTSSKLTNKN